MGAFYETIPQATIKWILEQACFWVSTAPLSGQGHVNVSPKGGPYFGIIDEKTFWYLDLTGSGSETISHLLEPGNGRITIMFNAYDGPPKIVRLWGKGSVLECGTNDFDNFVSEHKVKLLPGARSIIIVDIHQVGSSCGFSVPYYEFKGHRQVLNDLWVKKQAKFDKGESDETMEKYWAYKNAWSMDGLPSMKIAQLTGKKEKVAPIVKMVGPLAPRNGAYGRSELPLLTVLIIAILGFVLGMAVTTFKTELLDGFDQLASKADVNSLKQLIGQYTH